MDYPLQDAPWLGPAQPQTDEIPSPEPEPRLRDGKSNPEAKRFIPSRNKLQG